MQLASLSFLRTIIARFCPTLRRALYCPTVDDDGAWLCCSPGNHAQHHAQVVHYRLEHARREPACRLLMHRVPRRQVVRHHPPLRACSYYPPKPVEDFPQAVFPLWRVFPHQCQIWRYKRPFFVTYVAWICFSVVHPPILPKCMTGSNPSATECF